MRDKAENEYKSFIFNDSMVYFVSFNIHFRYLPIDHKYSYKDL